MPQSSGLNENSFCKTEKENSLIYSLTINENEAETKVKGLKVHLKLKYSHVLKKSWSKVWICETMFMFFSAKSGKLVF